MVKIIISFINEDIEHTKIFRIPLDNYNRTNTVICKLIEDMKEFFTL